MNFQKVAVCDDEKASLIAIKKYVEKSFLQYGIDFKINMFQSVRTMMKEMREDTYDLCFLDIDMPEMNGIDLAEKICRQYAQTRIIFVSAKEEYVFQSFRVHPFSFVRKSCFQDDMDQTIRDLSSLACDKEEQKQTFEIVDEAGYKHIFLTDSVYYLEAKEKYINVVLEDNKKLLRCSLKSVEKKLEPYGMIRCHKSYIVNIKKVFAVKYDHLVMLDKTELPIRRGMVTCLKERLCGILVE